MKIWFRVGMEAEISNEEMNALIRYQKNDKNIDEAYEIMAQLIKKAKLSGETYILENGIGLSGYDNPEEEISFYF